MYLKTAGRFGFMSKAFDRVPYSQMVDICQSIVKIKIACFLWTAVYIWVQQIC